MSDPRRKAYMAEVVQQLLDDLTWPVGADGNQMYVEPFKATVAWHLVRCGWRKPNNTDGLALVEEFDDPIIKARKILGPGVVEDAVTWVAFDEPDDPLEDLQNMTMAQIEDLPADLRNEAKRRLGFPVPNPPTPDTDPGWSVKPIVSITDADEGDDQTPERSK